MGVIEDSESNGKLKSLLEKYKWFFREDLANNLPLIRSVDHGDPIK